MKLLILDNYDSFTYNLVHIVRELGFTPDIFRNNKISLESVNDYDKILLSPGPGIPDEAGIMKDVIREYGATKSILGVCLGHQGIGEVYGASLFNLPGVLHGITSRSEVVDSGDYLFKNIPTHFQTTHYHSWAISPVDLPAELVVTSTNENGLIMGIRHTRYDVRGVQFHPESIMTPDGPKMIQNWLCH